MKTSILVLTAACGFGLAATNATSAFERTDKVVSRNVEAAKAAGSFEPSGEAPENAPENAPKAAPKPSNRKVAVRTSTYRAAKWHRGQGATWRTGVNSYGFAGSYRGCAYRGFAGPHGFSIDRVC